MIFLDKNSGDTLYEQIFQTLKQQIISGELQEQERLPATRKLATELQVSRNTIDQAYGQLCAEGYVTNRRGSGYYVNPLDFSFYEEADQGYHDKKMVARQGGATSDGFYAEQEQVWQRMCRFNLEYGTIPIQDFPVKKWKKIMDQVLWDAPIELYTAYGPRDGLLPLREALAAYLHRSRGVQCNAQQVIIGCSTQYLVQMVGQLLQMGFGLEEVALEEPGFSTARDAFALLHYHIQAIPILNDGLDLGILEQSSARVVYITPSHQYPTGAVLPVQKRLQLLRWAYERDGFILEDDYDSELRYRSMPIPALQGLCRNDSVIYLGTTSKAFAPTLRLAYMVLPERLLPTYQKLFQSYKSSVPELQQLAFAQFMNGGHWDSHLRKIQTMYKKKHDLFVRLLEQKLGSDFTLLGKGGGVHILLQSNNGMTETEMITRAKAQKVGIYPVSPCWHIRSQYAENQVMLGFAGLQLEQIDEVTTLLQQAFTQ